MKEHGILFKGEMVRAILNTKVGSWPPVAIDPSKPFKWQTRRIIKPQPSGHNYLQAMWGTSPPPNPVEFGGKSLWREVGPDYPDDSDDDRRPKYGPVGRSLWVRETWMVSKNYEKTKPSRLKPSGMTVFYKDMTVSNNDQQGNWGYDPFVWPALPPWAGRWRPSMFLPRWASRIDLEVMEIRVQRIQEISDTDILAEGINPVIPDNPESNDPNCPACHGTNFVFKGSEVECDRCDTNRKRFTNLWNSINEAPKPVLKKNSKEVNYYISHPFESIDEDREHKGRLWMVRGNPWVFAYSFKRTK